MPSVLIVDDLASIHEMLGTITQAIGFSTAFATHAGTALTLYRKEAFDVVLTDIDMKPVNGIALLGQLKQHDPHAVVIIMTGHPSAETAVAALRLGAFAYLQKPFRIEDLIATLHRGFEVRQGTTDRAAGVKPPTRVGAEIDARLIGRSAAMTAMISHVRKLATGRTPVLVIGEKGTGKCLLADVLHEASGGMAENIVRIDCALVSDASFLAGLFGRGGQVGSWAARAMGGTLVLRRIDALSLEAQIQLAGLLRAKSQDFRLVSTTSEDLEALVEQGKFDSDLFYRIASLPLRMPALRDRIEDIVPLVEYFAAQAANATCPAGRVEFSADALAAMGRHRWSGNVAELQQVVSQLSATTEAGIITLEHLPLRLRGLNDWPTLATYLGRREKHYEVQRGSGRNPFQES